MKTHDHLTKWIRLVLAAAMAIAVGLTITPGDEPNVAEAALGGLSAFEIDSNTVANGGEDWADRFAAGEVAVSNDANFTGAEVVQSDVGSATTLPDWIGNCPKSNQDSVFKNSTGIDDSDWTGDDETQSVTPKNDICQSYFAYDVIESGAHAGEVLAYLAFTRRVFNGDGSYYFVLSKGPNPNVRVAGDIVIEVGYDGQGDPQTLRTAVWEDNGGTLVLGTPVVVGVDDPNIELSPVNYFAEAAFNLTALGLAPNVYELPAQASCQAFGFGRVISRTGNSPSATLKDDGEPTTLDFNSCGTIIVQKELTSSVPSTTQFPITITAPNSVSLLNPTGLLEVPGGSTNGGTPADGSIDGVSPVGNPITWQIVPPRLLETYTVTEDLSGALGVAWDLDSISCVNDQGTVDTADDVTYDAFTGTTSQPFPVLTNDVVTCTIVNSPAPAVINVDKDAAGLAGSWPVDLSGDGIGQVTVTDDGTIDFVTGGSFETFGGLAAGSYTLTEGAETNGGAYRPTGWSCTVVGGGTTTSSGAAIGINANPGDVVNCTVTNAPVPPPSVTLVKSASPASFPEVATTTPIVYTVQVGNTGTEPFTITDLSDLVTLVPESSSFDLGAAVAGDPAGILGSAIVSNTCGTLIGVTVAPASSASCAFEVSYVGRNAGDVIDDTATVTVIDQFGRTGQAQDDATVTVTDVAPVITVDKANTAVGGIVDLVAPGGSATYDITITNGPDAIEPITITSVTDTMSSATNAGFPATVIDITSTNSIVTATDCGALVGTVLGIGESVSCTISVDTTQIAPLAQGDTVTNTVDVTAVDDDGTPVQGSDPATRNVLGEPPAMSVIKTDNDATIAEPGQEITYTFDITNQSTTENIFITSITDTVSFLPEGGTAPADLVPVGTVTISDPGGGVVVVPDLSGGATFSSTTCGALIGFELGEIGDPVLSNTTSCTMTLFLPGDAGDSYQDTVFVTAVDETGDPVDADNEAQTPVVDTDPVIAIVKDVAPATLPETGGQATFTLTITNNSVATDPLTLTALTDSVFGDLFGSPTGVDSNTCGALAGTILAPGASVNCQVTATLAGNAGTTHDNVATVTGVDDEGNEVSDNDPAQVTFTDVLPTIAVTKTADPTSVPETGGAVTFTVVVENGSGESVTTTTLTDSVFGNLVGLSGSTCVVGVTLQPSDGNPGAGADTYTCTFEQTIAQIDAELSHTNIVTATAVDDEGNEATADDDAVVDFELVPPTVEITKTDFDATLDEPGGDVVYSVDITNTSAEEVTVTSLTDTIYYADPVQTVGPIDLLGGDSAPISGFSCSADLVLDPNETITCTFTVALSGTAQIVDDTVAVSVVDNDGQTDDGTADEATPINDVRPAIGIVKTAEPTAINVGDTVTYTFVISNLSTIEDLTLLSLDDDKFGDIFAECSLTGVVLTPDDGAPGGTDETTCSIDRVLNEAPGTTHVNVATVTGADDETLDNLALPVEEQDPALAPVEASDDASVLTLAPGINVTKVAGSAVATLVTGNTYRATYTVQVINNGEGRGVYTLTEAPDFGDGIDIVSLSATSADATVNPNLWTGAPVDADVAIDQVLPAGETDSFTITAVVTVAHDSTSADRTCAGAGTAAFNTVLVTSNGPATDPATACVSLPNPAITITKVAVGNPAQPVSLGGNRFSATYRITVDNVGAGPGSYDLVDAPAFGAGATIEKIAVTGNGVDVTQNGAGPVAIISGESLDPAEAAHVYTVVVTFSVDGAMTAAARTCSGRPGAGAYNRGTVTYNGPTIVSDVDCVDIPDLDADLAIVKTASVAQVGAGGGFDWLLDITNNGPGSAVNVVIGDLVPSTVKVTGVSSSDFTCGATGNAVECTVGSLAVGASGTVKISVTVPSNAVGGDITNVGTVESDTPDPDLTNNSDDATVTVVAQEPPTTTVAPELPKTGSDATRDIARLAMMFLLLGGGVILITRRRRDDRVVID